MSWLQVVDLQRNLCALQSSNHVKKFSAPSYVSVLEEVVRNQARLIHGGFFGSGLAHEVAHFSEAAGEGSHGVLEGAEDGAGSDVLPSTEDSEGAPSAAMPENAVVGRDVFEGVIAERNAALMLRDAALVMRDSAVENCGSFRAARDAALAECAAAVAERDTAFAERAAALAERDTAIAERATALAERDTALTERAAAMAERDIASSQRATALAERDTAAAARAAALAARDSALADRATALAARAAACSERDTARADRAAAQSARAAAVSARAAAEAECVKLRGEVQSSKSTLDASMKGAMDAFESHRCDSARWEARAKELEVQLEAARAATATTPAPTKGCARCMKMAGKSQEQNNRLRKCCGFVGIVGIVGIVGVRVLTSTLICMCTVCGCPCMCAEAMMQKVSAMETERGRCHRELSKLMGVNQKLVVDLRKWHGQVLELVRDVVVRVKRVVKVSEPLLVGCWCHVPFCNDMWWCVVCAAHVGCRCPVRGAIDRVFGAGATAADISGVLQRVLCRVLGSGQGFVAGARL